MHISIIIDGILNGIPWSDSFGHEIALAMLFLEQHSLLHRDLAARNILLATNNDHSQQQKQAMSCKLADFGLSRLTETEYYRRTSTSSPVAVRWMATETLDDNVSTIESDRWSFGVLLWEIYTFGIRPYAGLANHEIADHIRLGHRLKQPPACPDELYTVMKECWSQNPQSRPHFSQLAATLRQHADAIRSFERTYESVGAASAPPVSPAPIVDADSAPPVSSAPIASGTSHGAAGVRCRACHATVSGNETFCRTCGVELQLAVAAVLPATAPAARHCKACQAPIDPDAKFCRACGASLSAQSLKTAAASPFAQATTTATNSQGPSFPSKMTSPQTSLSRENWSSTGAGEQKLFPLGTGSAEYASVADCFSLTLPAKQIDRIERVENAALHEAFGVATVIIHKQIALRKHSPGASIQSLLFHGTSAVDMIVNSTDGNGFLPLLSGTSVGAIFGEGTYFARDAKYSDAYALCLETGQKQLLVVDVLVGLWTQGAKGMKICPLLPGEKYSRFNSLVDNPQDPAIFVVQHSNQAYPKYLITYH